MLTAQVDKASLKRVFSALDDLELKLGDRALMTAMKRAMKPTVMAARQNAPRRSGSLARAVHTVKGAQAKQGSPYVIVRVNPKSQLIESGTGKKVTKRKIIQSKGYLQTSVRTPGRYLHWSLLGTRRGTRTTQKKGFVVYNSQGRPMRLKKIVHPGFSGRDWLQESWDKTRQVAVNGFLPELEKRINEVKYEYGLR
jgi:hypothetical protein